MTTATAPFLQKVESESPLLTDVSNQFEKVIAPIYGDQKEALQKIKDGRDRDCYVLQVAEKITGIVVFKTNPVNEFARQGIENALEIKTLFVVDSKENSNKGYGSQLLRKVEDYVQNNEKFSHIVVTVSESKQDSLAFFKRKGFEVITSFDKFEMPEHLLAKKV